MKSEWQACTIGELCDSVSVTYRREDERVVLVNTSDVLNGKVLNHTDEPNQNLKGQFKKTFKKNDILYSEIRPANRRFAYIDFDETEKYIASTKLMVIRYRENVVEPKFLYFLLTSNDVIGELQRLAETRSGTFPQITFPAEVATLPVNLPPLPIQRKIASILSALDDKIETNNDICRNLEELMESMYNKLFVENYNSEWVQGTISDLGRIVGGGTPSKKEPSYYTQQGIPWITPKDLSRNTAKFIKRGEVDITLEGLNASGATIMPAGTVLFSSRAPIGYIAIACNDVTTNQGFKSVIPHDFVGSAYLYYFLKANKNAIEMRASGSTFLEVSAGIMRQVPAIIPDKSTLDIFKHFCNPLFEMQRKLETETVSLSQLRESLLPKLMSGELDVDKIEL